MADPAAPPQATATAVPPAFITDLTETGEIDWTDRKVKLFDMSFLGKRFGTNKDFPANGINKDLAQRLVRAQTALYALAYQDKVDDLAAAGQPAPAALTEAEFRVWCWTGQQPGDVNQVAQVDLHVGIKDKKNPNSKHASGSALDINVFANPYMPVRDGSGTLGGEIHSSPKDAAKKPIFDAPTLRKLHEDKLWRPAMVIFDRASMLYEGVPADLHPDLNGANAADMYKRFRTASYCIESYFRFAFNPVRSKINPLQKTFAEFKTEILNELSDGFIDPKAVHIDGTPLVPAISGPNPDPTLQAFYDQIVADYAFFKMPIVSGSVVIGADGSVSLPGNAQRDPCNAVFNVRQEVFMEMVKIQKLRWGGTMFGKDSGDTMHFDLNGHFIDGEQVPFKKT
ncbi:MAG: Peptidoglycan-binding domain 1 protein [Fibrobacteres bacterium]|nr:Peptidoglycan-binding domain 1 protein [Fibrobacterota bacterium]